MREDDELEPVCYTPEQMTQIVGASEEMWKGLYSTAAKTGVRAGELYALEVKDIDIARNVIHIRVAAWEGQKQSTKTRNATRAIDAQPSLIYILWNYLNGKMDGLVFPAKNGKPLRNNNVLRKQLHPLLAKLGIPKVGCTGFGLGRFRS